MIEVAVAPGALLGESPLWSDTEAALYWIDIDGRSIHRLEPGRGLTAERALPGRPGSIALTADAGRLLMAIEHELGFFEWGPGSIEPWLELEPAGTGNRMNDGRVGPGGRFWVGSMFERPAERRATGMLYRVDPDGTVTTHRRNVGVSNALAFAPDDRTMYWADTHTLTVWAHDYDPSSGEPGVARQFADFTDLPGAPDGACVDDAGGVWIAGVGGGAVLRFTPDGSVDRILDLPVRSPTMPAFGGPQLDTLFVTSIGPAAASASSPSAGALDGAVLAIDTGARGLPEPRFVRAESSRSRPSGEPGNGDGA